MTFENAYNYLLSLANIPRNEYPRASAIPKKRLQLLLDILENPEQNIPHFIHVTGTSGKGSTVAACHAILHQAGFKTGSTYSPHATFITERWRIGNKNMSKKEFVAIIDEIKHALERYIQISPYDVPSFLEIIQAISFLWFAQKQVDWAIVEVGCGGRHDVTNILPHKDIAIITNIGRDHIGFIGNTLADITYEKSGIITTQTNHVLSMEKRHRLQKVITHEAAKHRVKNIHFLPQPKYDIQSTTFSHTTFKYNETTYTIPLIGKHQIKNTILAIEVAKILGLKNDVIQKGIKNIQQPVRMEVISQKPIVIIDGGHNKDKIKATVSTVTQLAPKNNIHLLIGFSAGKNITPMLKSLMSLKPKTIACTRFTNNPFRKVVHPNEIAKACEKLLPGTKIHVSLDPQTALEWSKKQQKTDDILLVTGSVFLGGEIREMI